MTNLKLRFSQLGLLFFVTSQIIISQTFTEQAITLTGLSNSSVAWGDYDSDGDLDILLTGDYNSKIYRNDAGVFNDISASLVGINRGSAKWGDYDNDGDLDILLIGGGNSRIYRNNAGIFTDINAGLPGVYESSAEWGDYDNDGDLDIILAGGSGNRITKIYRNNGDNTFSELTEAVLAGIDAGSVAWGDYDKDGDLDILLSGYNDASGIISKVYRNDNNVFTDINAGITGLIYSSVAWGDYDNDGDLDILSTGYTWYTGNYYSIIYRNDAGVFTDISAGLTGVRYSSTAWGDYDNDGDLDVLLTGETASSGYISKIYRNDAGVFTDIAAGLTAVYVGSVAWGDYDKDGDLDILLAGWTGTASISKIYKNNSVTLNTIPAAPSGLLSSVAASAVTLSWNKSTDTQTAQNGLSYNIYIGSTAGSINRRSPMAALPGGYRRIAQKGVIQSNSWPVKKLPAGTYYWSVQAIDNCLAGSAFATEGSFIVAFSNSIAPVADQTLLINQSSAALTVTESSTPTSRQWKYSTTSGGPYNQIITGATLTTCSPAFPALGVYYVVCESVKGGLTYTSNQVKIIVSNFQEQTGIVLTGVQNSSVAWGDYDNDGDLDLLMTGDSSNVRFSRIYRNNAGVFTNIVAGLTGVNYSSVDWGDYDNDGDLDILLTGNDGSSSFISKIYRTDAGVFTDINAGLTGVMSGSVAWGDYDNDGDLDILLAGDSGSETITKIYRNDAGVFSDINTDITGARTSSVDWGDYDNDGDLDILISGYNNTTYGFTKIYRNDNGTFNNINASLYANPESSVEWGDYDNDGDLDILLSVYNDLKIYNNSNGTFNEITASFTDIMYCKAAWGDYDNDGDLDFLVTGNSKSRIFQNNNGVFSEIIAGLTGVTNSFAAWGDYDNDGDLDIILTGYSSSGYVSKIYKSNTATPNTAPDAPAGLNANVAPNKVTFSWTKSTDTQTPQDGLGYNLYIGTSTGSPNRKSPMAAIPGGYRRIVQKGIVQTNSWWGNRLPAGTYYWSVQAIDNSFTGSAFATEGSFTIPFSLSVAPVTDQTLMINQNGSPLTVTESSTPVSRQWKYSTVSGGPYNQAITGATGLTYTPNFTAFGTYYVVCESSKGGIAYTSNEVKIDVPAFSEQSGIILTGIQSSSVKWGDYDNDGDLDILLAGYSYSSGYITKIYRNDAGVFTDIVAGLAQVTNASAAWGDYDNDGDLDILLTGWSGSPNVVSIIYRNDTGVFTDINAGLTAVSGGSVAWGDFDNDGDLDVCLSGNDFTNNISKIYRNDGGVFIDLNAGLTGVAGSSVAWGDYDNDSDQDLIVTGNGNSRIYRNDSGVFTDINAGLSGVTYSSVAWGDYDSDGDLDLLLSGSNNSKIYKNDAGVFTDINAGLAGVYNSSAAWGDYDNDGDLDIILTGNTNSGSVSKIYRNDSGIFTDIVAGLTGVRRGSVAWGDYDKDGDLDIMLAGDNISKIYKNNASVSNAVPSAPTNLQSSLASNKVTLSWNKSTDSKTLQDGLTYNLYIGTSAGSINKKSPMAALPGGYRKVVQRGTQTNSWPVKWLAAGTYYWSVQAIDNNFAGSSFATEGSFVVAFSNSISPVTQQTLTINQNGAPLTVTESSTPTSRLWKYSTVSGGPYDQTITGATSTTYTPNFSAFGTYFVVCESSKGGVAYTTNEVKIIVPAFAEQTGIVLTATENSSDKWGDYDSDGDLDILITGYSSSGYTSKIYRNDLGVYNDINAGLAGVDGSSVAWRDYDNDGDLDILLTGYSGAGRVSKIYRNDTGVFTDINAGLTGVNDGSVAWGDYDNDGDPDVLLTGSDGSTFISKIYRNDAGVFNDINADLRGINQSSVEWGDYDNDGDLDILLSGYNSSSGLISTIYRNDSGVFTDLNAGLQGFENGSSAWGDYDSDGDLDILLSGNSWWSSGDTVKIYNNNAGVFTDIKAVLLPVDSGSASWGDLDNDGDLDIFISGWNGTERISKIYRNDNSIFTDITNVLTGYSFTGVTYSSVDLGDYDNDGDLDILLSGYIPGGRISKIYKNNVPSPNTVPSAPSNLQASLGSNKVTLSWNKSTDSKTAQDALTYNLYIGTSAGSINKKSPMAAIPGGYRRISQKGNQTNSWPIKWLTAGTYYWSVQAIDNSYAGSTFATEGNFTVTFSNSIAPVANQTLLISQNGTTLTVTESSAPTSRQWKYSKTSGGPYDQTIAGATATTYTPNFSSFGIYYVICESIKSGITYSSNEVKINVPAFAEQTAISLPGADASSVRWGDYDSDGDLDILITGYSNSGYLAKIFRNDAGVFNDINAGLTGVEYSSSDWGDYDNDGDLDLILTGYYWDSNGQNKITKIYRNDAGVFTDIVAGLTGVGESSVAWGDYDNDGDLDILLTGRSNSGSISKVYRNDAGVFTDINAGLKDVQYGSADWGDYDTDGDLDILLTGNGLSVIYNNSNGLFTDIAAGLRGVSSSSSAWGDYDSDGDLDVVLAGYMGPGDSIHIYRNDSGVFNNIKPALTGVEEGSVIWGDFDNDGDLDILLTGRAGNSGSVSKLYRNDSGVFTDITNASDGYYLAEATRSALAVGDYDNDGDIDVLLAGAGSEGRIAKIYKNNITTVNAVPTAPSNLQASLGSNIVTLSWNKSTDTKTPQDGLGYNLYIGTSAGSINRKSPMSAIPGGYRRIVLKGNQVNSWPVKWLTAGTYYWSVQAIDNTYAGSAFATEVSFVVTYSNSIAPVADQTLLINENGAVLTVTESSAATSRQWKYSTVSGGPYDQTIAGATALTYTPVFSTFGTYYVVCESVKTGITYTSNEVKINVPAFSEQTGIILDGLSDHSSVAWGDYDNDGDLDILLAGNSNSGRISKIFRNDLGVFNDINAGLTGINNNSASWGDFDKDGDLDILLTGYSGSTGYISKVYRNDSGIFTDINAGLPGVFGSSVAWGDCDNDGDLDILLTGWDGAASTNITKIYKNDAGIFTDLNAGLIGITWGSAVWGDYDNDGDKDILLTGNGLSKIYKNNGDITFTEQTSISLQGVGHSSVAWGDYDNDGDLDILLSGDGVSKIYKNNGDNTFTDQTAISLQGVGSSSVAWGDYDNDGNLDILLTGWKISKVYRNNGDGTFTEPVGISLTGVNEGSVGWGDYDNDGDLDILLSGNPSSGYFTRIYRNNGIVANTLPAAPTALIPTAVSISKVTLAWNKATDTQTPQNSLTYNIRMGTSAGGSSIVSPMASTSTGYRKIPATGNAEFKNSGYSVANLAPGKYYWSVQAVDQAYAGGAWATEGSFLLLAAPVANAATNIAQTSFTSNWTASTGATGYRLDVASDTTFTTILTGYNNKDVANVTSYTVSGLTANTKYFYRIRAYNAGGPSIVNSNIITATTIGVPLAPVANPATNVLQTTFTANWSAAATATSYQLDVSTSNTFATFLTGYNNRDVGTVTSFNITGLTANTTYYYRVRASNSYGPSANSATITVVLAPAVPVGLTISSCNNLVTLTWTANTEPNFLRYRIYGGTTTNPTTKIDSVSSILTNTKIISGLTHGLTYYFRITAVNTGGVASTYGTQVSSVVKTGVIPKVKTKWNNVLICYNTGDSLASFQWYKGTSAIAGATKQYYLTNKQVGSYYVQGTDKAGCKNNSTAINISGTKSISVYPNPATTSFELSLTSDDIGKTIITLYNSFGIKVLEYQTEKQDQELVREIPIPGIQTGTYTLEVSVNNEKVDYSRIVIVK